MSEKTAESGRRRKWAPKARTGCRTCKTRHVKCDETKPICRRCVLSGFRCDGYPAPPTKDDREDSPNSDESPKAGSKSRDKAKLKSVIVNSRPEPSQINTSVPTSREESTSSSNSSPTGLSSTVLTSNTSMSSATSILSPLSPYQDQTELRALKFFVDMTATMVGRSRSAPYFWAQLVPQAAWQYPCARNAMVAAATSHEALFTRATTTPGRLNVDKQVVAYASKSINALLTEKAPLDVVMLTSATLGILDLFNGQWRTACTHVTSGAKLAEQARQDPVNNAYISFYCQAFASALPEIMKRVHGGSTIGDVEPNAIIRLSEGIRSLELALASFNRSLPKVNVLEDEATRSRIIIVLRNSKLECERLLPRWQALLTEEKQEHADLAESSMVDVNRIESPWSNIISELDLFLDQGGCLDVAKFEVAMERTMPFFALSKSGPNVRMREEAVALMYFGMKLRKGMLDEETLSGESSTTSTSTNGSPPAFALPYDTKGS